MTPKQRAVIEAARRAVAKFIEIDPKEGRVTRFTAHENTMRKLSWRGDGRYGDKCAKILEWEQQRLMRLWHDKKGL